MASHWVVKSKAEILKIVKRTANRDAWKKEWDVIACVIRFGVLGAGIGFPVALLGLETGVFGKQQGFSGFTYLIGSMWVFGILGAALGGYVGYRIIRSKSFK